jgi:hypothetical protein
MVEHVRVFDVRLSHVAGEHLLLRLPPGFFQVVDRLAARRLHARVQLDFGTQSGPTPHEPSWSEFYANSQQFEAAYCGRPDDGLQYQNAILAESSVPAVSNYHIKNFPQFDLGIPD